MTTFLFPFFIGKKQYREKNEEEIAKI